MNGLEFDVKRMFFIGCKSERFFGWFLSLLMMMMKDFLYFFFVWNINMRLVWGGIKWKYLNENFY